MGCICCKPSAIEGSKVSPRDRLSRKPSSDLTNLRPYFPRRDESHRAREKYSSGNDERFISSDKLSNGSLRLVSENHDGGSRERIGHDAVAPHPAVRTISKATEVQQNAAGWPPWLVAVAGEAIKGWLPRRADSFEKLDKIGQVCGILAQRQPAGPTLGKSCFGWTSFVSISIGLHIIITRACAPDSSSGTTVITTLDNSLS